MNFSSDNVAGAHEAVLRAVVTANANPVAAYGDDALSAEADKALQNLFEKECAVFFVTTGTAANALALSAFCPPWGAVYCHVDAHILNDENTAVELFSGGARLVGIAGHAGKPDPVSLQEAIESAISHGVHSAQPAVISLSNVTEAGTVYTPEELSVYRRIADHYDMKLHVDGARFANAVVASGASPAELSWQAGVDGLSFGLTKNGGIATEAVVVFDPDLAQHIAYQRKRAGHLWSKQRFIAAQWLALLSNELWRENAVHANAMANRLAQGLASRCAIDMPWPVEANEVFPVLLEPLRNDLRNEGVAFYDWPVLPNMARFVTHFGTTPGEVDELIELIAKRSMSI